MIDILIRGALIVDGTGKPPSTDDIAIEGDLISKVGSINPRGAQKVIDAEGKVVAPGFIDMHSHADLSLPALPSADSLIRQGITTIVVGQCGLSPAPMRLGNVDATLATLLPYADAMPWDRMGAFPEYLELLTELRPSVNVVPLIGHNMIRSAVMGYSSASPDENQIARMKSILEESLKFGAFGMSTGLIYPPGSFCSTEELVEISSILGRMLGIYFSHIRDESERLEESVSEAVEIGRRSGASVQISHLKAFREGNWHKIPAVLGMLDEANAGGIDVTADMYPYVAGSTFLATVLPRWVMEGGIEGALMRIRDRSVREKIITEMRKNNRHRWDQILISNTRQRRYVGRYVSELAELTGKEPVDWVLDALSETDGDLVMVGFGISEENIRAQLRHPLVMIGTDGLGLVEGEPEPAGMVHPRSFGTYPRIFGKYVREEGVLTLEEASWKCSGFPARKLGLQNRGVIEVGNFADLVIFDPRTINDRATFVDPRRYPVGIEHVVVNGKLAVENGKSTRARSGRVLKRGREN